ncbi:MAG TPA: 16S rRNA (cytosine(1402)-N(4))-methyltransferase RsmH [Steroidobacteraceae bacterium]|nr:16S rRNA (cytosine(1402)-N(4))-methyltransferase RsmH [Steroidobacteraceae bacterium]
MDAHAPVLVEEVLAALEVKAEGWYCDATFGRGGHSAAILARLGERGRLIAFDRDAQAVAVGRGRFGEDPRFAIRHAAFASLEAELDVLGVSRGLDGVIFDLGVSSPQLDDAARGFSFMRDGPLDMRMDTRQGQSAATWLARAPLEEIEEVIATLGEDRFARRIARAIVDRRSHRPFERTADLAAVIAGNVRTREPGKHPATRSFQAIRMHVNAELGQLESGLEAARRRLAGRGRLGVISFHSLEDRLVKRFMRRHAHADPMYAGLPMIPEAARPTLRIVGKAVRPSAAEIERNARARSATLRVAERLDA